MTVTLVVDGVACEVAGEVRAGLSWRRFVGHVAGLSPDAAWLRWRRHQEKDDGVILEGEAAEASVRQIR